MASINSRCRGHLRVRRQREKQQLPDTSKGWVFKIYIISCLIIVVYILIANSDDGSIIRLMNVDAYTFIHSYYPNTRNHPTRVNGISFAQHRSDGYDPRRAYSHHSMENEKRKYNTFGTNQNKTEEGLPSILRNHNNNNKATIENNEGRRPPYRPLKEKQQQKTVFYSRNNINNNKNNKRNNEGRRSNNAKDPEAIEHQMNLALESMKATWSSSVSPETSNQQYQTQYLFPTIRECNAAIANFGDNEDLLRALKLFGKMRKAAALYHYIQIHSKTNNTDTLPTRRNQIGGRSKNEIYNNQNNKLLLPLVPIPTLVTYSTLMSRAVKLNKPIVALRLWNLMISSSTSHQPSIIHNTIVNPNSHYNPKNSLLSIDVKAANILMNCYAKLADVESAKQLLNDMKYQNLNVELKDEDLINDKEKATATKLDGERRRKVQPYQLKFPTIQLPPPNLVTYNTFLSVCHKAKDLDSAMEAFQDLNTTKVLRPDERTYTTLITTVARKSCRTSGKNDPTIAFALLDDMIEKHKLRPNGITYSALIDVCSRCNRSDLALYGLRVMIRQKVLEKRAMDKKSPGRPASLRGLNSDKPTSAQDKYMLLSNEVGAWTAAINACGKAGRVDTALRLFYSMYPKFGVLPNTVTCGCLTDSLLRVSRIADTLDVLRYMKRHYIMPSEVMYTSLMSRASKLVRIENRQQRYSPFQQEQHPIRKNHHFYEESIYNSDDSSTNRTFKSIQEAKAIEVYTELIRSLSSKNSILASSPNSNNRKKENNQNGNEQKYSKIEQQALLKAFLVFQEMKDVGAVPDLACYNSLLSACSRAGDLQRAEYVMRLLQEADDTIVPNDTSWRLFMRTALTATSLSSIGISKSPSSTSSFSAGENNMVERIWCQAVSYHHPKQQQKKKAVMNASFRIPTPAWQPSIESFHLLLSSYIPQSSVTSTNNKITNNNRILDVSSDSKSSSLAVLINQHSKVIQLYNDVLMGHNIEMGMDRIDINGLLDNPKTMSLILKSILVLENIVSDVSQPVSLPYTVGELRTMANSIAKLDCFQAMYSFDVDHRRFTTQITNNAIPSSSELTRNSSVQINTSNIAGSLSTQSALKKALSWS